eukprot:jgi/Galph1/5713/GphlegSOOS_G4369.1
MDESGEIIPEVVSNHIEPIKWKRWSQKCPLALVTRNVFVLLLLLNLVASLLHLNNNTICLSFSGIYDELQMYRILIAPWFCHSAPQLLSTSFLWCVIAGQLETVLGSLLLLYIVFWFIMMTGVLYMLFGWLLSPAQLLPFECPLGISNVIFALLVIYFSVFDYTMEAFGYLHIPSWTFPWLLLIVCQAMVPTVSFVGHLSGVVAGVLFVHQICIIPNSRVLLKVEESRWLSWIVNKSGYVSTIVVLEGAERYPLGTKVPVKRAVASFIDDQHVGSKVSENESSENTLIGVTIIGNGHRSHPSSRSSSEGREQEFLKWLNE